MTENRIFKLFCGENLATRGSGSVSARPTRVALVEAAARCRPLDRLASEDLTYRSTYISAYKGSAKVSLIILEKVKRYRCRTPCTFVCPSVQ